MIILAKGQKSGHATCDIPGCPSTSRKHTIPSSQRGHVGLATTVIQEAVEEEGWKTTWGFWSMLQGPKVVCPEHLEEPP